MQRWTRARSPEDPTYVRGERLGSVDGEQQSCASQPRPRATRSPRRTLTAVALSVSPSHSPEGTLMPSPVVVSATTTQHSPTSLVHHHGSHVWPGQIPGQKLGQLGVGGCFDRRLVAAFDVERPFDSIASPFGSDTKSWGGWPPWPASAPTRPGSTGQSRRPPSSRPGRSHRPGGVDHPGAGSWEPSDRQDQRQASGGDLHPKFHKGRDSRGV